MRVPLAAQSIDSGAAAAKLAALAKFHHKQAESVARLSSEYYVISIADFILCFAGSILKVLFVVSLSGTLPSFTTISSGGCGTSTRITPLLLPRTTSRLRDFSAGKFHRERNLCSRRAQISTVMVSM